MTSTAELTLDESKLSGVSEAQRPVFIYEWLLRLERALTSRSRASVEEVRAKQKVLVQQLMTLVQQGSPGPPTRDLLARCLTTLFTVGDTFLLFDTINK